MLLHVALGNVNSIAGGITRKNFCFVKNYLYILVFLRSEIFVSLNSHVRLAFVLSVAGSQRRLEYLFVVNRTVYTISPHHSISYSVGRRISVLRHVEQNETMPGFSEKYFMYDFRIIYIF